MIKVTKKYLRGGNILTIYFDDENNVMKRNEYSPFLIEKHSYYLLPRMKNTYQTKAKEQNHNRFTFQKGKSVSNIR